MARKKSADNYFSHQEEEAVKRFLNSNSQKERNDIYNQYLRDPLNKMVESIIRKYKLYRKDYSFEEIHADTLSFLITKSSMFDGDKNKKAYSYYGTICKNYLLTLLDKDEKKLKKNLSYEDVYKNINENEEYSYTITDESYNYNTLFDNIINTVEDIIELKREELLDPKVKPKIKDRNVKDIKLGEALIEMFKYRVDIMMDAMGKNKTFNKDVVRDFIREYTRMDLNEIRTSLKSYKLAFKSIKKDMIDNDEF